MKRILTLLLTVVLLAGIFTACTPAQTEPTGSAADTSVSPDQSSDTSASTEEKMLLLPLPDDTTDKWPTVWYNYGFASNQMVFRCLLMCDENLNPVYDDIASAHTVSADGLTYTFTIRDGVKWHDGVSFTPEDLIWSIKMSFKSAQITSLFPDNFKKIVGAQDYIDGKTDTISGIGVNGNVITINLVSPVSTFLFVMANFAPLPMHLLENETPETLHLAAYWEKPVGSGPYMITEFVPSEYAILEKFDGFYGSEPKIEKVKLSLITEGDYITRSQANEIDYFNTRSLEIVNEVLKNPNYVAHPANILYYRYFHFNLLGYGGEGNSLVSDIRVRQAIMHAIDRQAIVDQLFPGQGAVGNTMVPEAMPEYNTNAVTYDYNPQESIQLLEAANYDFSRPLKIVYYYDNQQTQDLMDAIVFYLGEVGISVEHSLLQGDVTSALYESRQYDLAYMGFAPGSYEEVYATYKSDDPVYSQIRPSGPNDFDALIDQLYTTSDLAERVEIIKQLQIIEGEYLWNGVLYNLTNYVVVNESRLTRPGDFGNEWVNYNRDMENWELK